MANSVQQDVVGGRETFTLSDLNYIKNKEAMRIKLLFFPLLVVAILALSNWSLPAFGPCDSPFVGGHTGAPGESSCTGCHGGTANTGPGSLELELGDNTLLYSPGESFNAIVTLRQSGRDKFGFVGLALKNDNNTSTGTFSIDDIVRTRTYSDGPRQYVSHTPCGADAEPTDSLSWIFHWQAPDTNVGPITLYLAGLAANHNHALSGDDTYTLTVHFVPDSTALGFKDPVSFNLLKIWPNPVSDIIYFAIDGSDEKAPAYQAEIWSMNGRLQRNISLTQNKISIADLEAGFYILRISDLNSIVLGQASFIKFNAIH